MFTQRNYVTILSNTITQRSYAMMLRNAITQRSYVTVLYNILSYQHFTTLTLHRDEALTRRRLPSPPRARRGPGKLESWSELEAGTAWASWKASWKLEPKRKRLEAGAEATSREQTASTNLARRCRMVENYRRDATYKM